MKLSKTGLRTPFAIALLSSAAPVALTPALAGSYEIDDIAVFNSVNIEDRLNTLPQFIPGFDASSNDPGDGSSRLNLRGLGSERTLILLDGRRLAPFGGGDRIDVNMIPASLIERVEVLTGEGAVRYGSGAIGGVVNFVLKDEFQGVELSVSDELSAAEWDANLFNVSLVAGTGFADDRGHIMVSGSYTKREGVLSSARAFSSVVLQDPGPGGIVFIEGGSSNIPGVRFRGGTSSNFGISPEIVDPACGAGNINSCFGFWNAGGSGAAGDIRGLRFGGTLEESDLYNYAPSNFLRLPQERYNITGMASYEINDHIEAYMRGLFSSVDIDSQLAPTPSGAIPVTINIDNPAIPADLLAIITADPGSYFGGPTANIRVHKRFEEVGNRITQRESENFQLLGGLRGDLNSAWSYDAFFSYSRSDVDIQKLGGVSFSAVQAGAFCDTGPSAVASGCTAPYVDIFGGAGGISAAGAAFIARDGAQAEVTELMQTGGTLSGRFDTFWGTSGAALDVGFEYRELKSTRVVDSVLGPDVRGLNASLPLAGRYDIYEAFGEVSVPLVQGKAFFDDLTISGGARWSDHSVAGDAVSYSGGVRWAPVKGLAFSGGYQKSHRAPNISELFSENTNFFPAITDPCAGGGGGFSPAVINSTCLATGVPAANVGGAISPVDQIPAVRGGNPDLKAETAKTLTLGIEVQPGFVEGLTISGEYFNIDIKDAITSLAAQLILNECHFAGQLDFCALITRSPGVGVIQSIRTGNINSGSLKSKGIDISVRYVVDDVVIGGASVGSLTADFIATRTLTARSSASFSSQSVECNRFYGFLCGDPTPRYKHSAQITHGLGPLATTVRWRYIGGVGAGSNTIRFLSDLSDSIGSANYIDISTQYAINDSLDLTVGVRNITGKDAPLLGSTVSEQANTFPAVYETLGRQVFAGASFRF